jgi:hypothetical protein
LLLWGWDPIAAYEKQAPLH